MTGVNQTRRRMQRRWSLFAAGLCALSCLVVARESHVATPRSTPICEAKQFGATGDGTTKDTRAIQAAINACEQKGGGIVRLSGGTFLTGPIVLKNHITLEVDQGTRLLGSQDAADYPAMEELGEPSLQSLIGATNAESITIRGGGVIDGAGQPWWDEVYAQKKSPNSVASKRPRLILFDRCRHVLIENVTIQNSPSWQVVFYRSDDVTIRDSKILAPEHSPNTDGIDPFSSSHVTIAHMVIDVGDDNVAIKSGQPNSPGLDPPSTDIAVTDCLFLHGHGMSIGSEVAGGVENVHVARIRFRGTTNGVRVKSNRDRGADIGHLDFRDLMMQDVGTPILITEYYPRIPEHDAAQPLTRLTPHFHDIHIAHLTATGAQETGMIAGLPESPITSIVLDDVHLKGAKGLTISQATVAAHNLTVVSATPPRVILLEHGQLNRE
jgi:polygalacturonase